ncbi:MAG: RNase J family beta-CASP ribonuclease [Actinomycetota bacterium]
MPRKGRKAPVDAAPPGAVAAAVEAEQAMAQGAPKAPRRRAKASKPAEPEAARLTEPGTTKLTEPGTTKPVGPKAGRAGHKARKPGEPKAGTVVEPKAGTLVELKAGTLVELKAPRSNDAAAESAETKAGRLAEPKAGRPAEPKAGRPAEPKAARLVDLGAASSRRAAAGSGETNLAKPAEGKAGKPAQPKAGRPAEPKAGRHAEPKAPRSHEAAAEPAKAKPAPSSEPEVSRAAGHKPAKPAGPAGTEGAEAKPARPAGGKAGKPEPGKTRIVFLGGVGEIGRNMTLFEHDGQTLIIDTGLMFPTEEMLGVDLVLPDFGYVREHASSVIGMVLTHAHEDHIGGIPFLLRDVNPPIYGTKLTLGILKGKLDEHRLTDSARLNEIKPGGRLTLGPFKLRFLQVAHSIPGCVAIAVTTSAGTMLFTGDWKLDPTPVDGRPTDVAAFAQLGGEGVDLLLSDSTNALVPGHLPSERSAGEAVRDVVRGASGRVVIACFASNIHRIQQILHAADETGRVVAFIGRSMVRNVQIASELGYLDVPPGVLVSVDEASRSPSERVIIVCTGSQGEPLSALSLMAVKEHRFIELTEADTVVFSATPIPGNESAVRRVVDGLSRIGVEVIAPPAYAVHVSGHAAAGELRTMLSLVRPKWFIPVHGEYRMLKAHARIAMETGVPAERTMLVEDGDVVEISKGRVQKAGSVPGGYIFVDGIGIGDVEDVVLRDRRLLSEDGILVCVLSVDRQTGEMLADPDLISRGFVYEGQAGHFYEEARAALAESLQGVAREELADWAELRRLVRRSLGKFVWSRTGRRPIILPVVVEV